MSNANETMTTEVDSGAAREAGQRAVHSAPLTDVERAALILLSMGEEAAGAVLRCLSREELLDVTLVMARMRGMKIDAVRETIEQFFNAFRAQSRVSGASRAFLQRSLDVALGGPIANSVLNRIYGDVIGPKMTRLQWAQPRWIADRLAMEHVRMQAMFVAFLPPEQGSEVIAAMPAERRETVLLAIARLKEIDHALLNDLEAVVDTLIDDLGTQSTVVEGARQAAELINRMPGDRSRLVAVMRESDPEIMSAVEERIYDFAILARQSDATIAALLDRIEMNEWAVALKGAAPELRDALLRSMPRRSVTAFEDLLNRTGPVPVSRVDAVRRAIMEQVRSLATDGEIDLQLIAEEVV
ncbi:FliG C-terminal domain-containing protein [Burkholderia metallica]|uniref:Flagellar motor switch protein FliG n=1 Tax=Burkholderia metallica TaxID=488729 RepID=A0ABT8PIK0_9BURK|nr:FliG C-terminal domain-containing protein [Burkholderia metallica]MDN7934701.1 FliG C-terminal domain-containing protein [Burkholderia metallica]